MQIELKNVKHSELASQETHCFECSIYIDGKRAGMASNEGRGGSNHYYPHSLQQKLDDYAKTLPPITLSLGGKEGSSEPLEQDADIVIGDLLNAYLTRKVHQRLCRGKTVFRIPGETYAEGEYNVVKHPFSAKVKEVLIKRHGEGLIFLNEEIAKPAN